METIETDEARQKRVTKENAETLMRAGNLLRVNQDTMLQFVVEELGAPSEAHAKSSLDVALLMLGCLAGLMMRTDSKTVIYDKGNIH
jgi:hypothetical protein